MSSVSATHPEYGRIFDDWATVRDVVEGERVIKEKGTTYLPVASQSQLNADGTLGPEYARYKQRASFQNFTASTVESMVGAVFRKDPSMNSTDWGRLEYLVENVDGQRNGLDLQAKEVCNNVVQVGRDGLLVDFPRIAGRPTLADVEAGRAIATIQRRDAEDIINWRWDPFGAEKRLVLVVLREAYNKSQGQFEYENDFRYRVLRIDPEDGFYYQDIYLDSMSLDSPVESIRVMANGRPLNFIPFIFVGTKQNNAEVVKPPILDIANANLAHYRVDAEQKHVMHKHSTPQPVAEGVDQNFRDEHKETPMKLGSDTVLMLPPDSRFKIEQVQFEHTGFQDELGRLEAAMKKMGARLLDDNNRARESGDALAIRRQAHNSVMSSISKNISKAYELAVTWCGLFMGETVEPIIKLNTDFKMKTMDANLVAQLSLQVDKGYISIEDYHQALRDGEILEPDRTTDEILADAANNPVIPTLEESDGGDDTADAAA